MVKKRHDIAVDWQVLMTIISDIHREGKMTTEPPSSYDIKAGRKFYWQGKEGMARIKNYERALITAKDIPQLKKAHEESKRTGEQFGISGKYEKLYYERYEILQKKKNREGMEALFTTAEERMIANKFIEKKMRGRAWEEIDTDTPHGGLIDDSHIIAFGKKEFLEAKERKQYIDISPKKVFKRKELGDLEGLAFGNFHAKTVWEMYSILGKKNVKFKVHKNKPYPLVMKKGNIVVHIAPRLEGGDHPFDDEQQADRYKKRIAKVKKGDLTSDGRED
jgi:hypothetical protein